MGRFILERVMAAPPERVFAIALDVDMHLTSMAKYDETMVDGPADGTFTEGSTVTWRARHFGIPFRLTTVVYDVDPPHGFRDRQVRGPFASFLHEHEFVPHPDGTLMRDTVTFRSPLGPLGRLVDLLILNRYMRTLISTRNAALASALSPL